MIDVNHPETKSQSNYEDREMEIDDDTFDEMIHSTYSRRDDSDDDTRDQSDNDQTTKLSHIGGGVKGARVKIKFDFQKVSRSRKERAKRSFINVIGNHRGEHSTLHEGKSRLLTHTDNGHNTLHGGPSQECYDRSRDLGEGQ